MANEEYEIYKDKIEKMIGEIGKAVVGKRREIKLLLTALLTGGHVLIEDVPGTGKTTLASAVAAAFGLSFKRAQFTPDLMASDITGFNIYNRQKETFVFTEGLVMCNILLADEINRASPKTQSALLEAMEEGQVTVDGVSYTLPEPFTVIATQNPAGFVGTYPLPEAQLDRFSVRLTLGYPTKAEEERILADRRGVNPLSSVRCVSNAEELSSMKKLISEIKTDELIYSYIVDLTSQTRKRDEISLGASPRASLIVMRMAQATAFMNGRNYVVPEDVAEVFVPSVSHRIVLHREARSAGVTSESILFDILKNTEIPYGKQ
ncbi:MAG: MoxR family ATPase [Clostridia bacterium]|nr:MoxR family ATPase [Clostridia bacterium]